MHTFHGVTIRLVWLLRMARTTGLAMFTTFRSVLNTANPVVTRVRCGASSHLLTANLPMMTMRFLSISTRGPVDD